MKELNTLFGYKIIEDSDMLKPETKIVPRTWKERFFSFPFNPIQKTKKTVEYVPDSQMVVIEKSRTIFMHPTVLEKLKDKL
jgi:hypothetical protein